MKAHGWKGGARPLCGWSRRGASILAGFTLWGCTVTSVPTRTVELGAPVSLAAMTSSLGVKGTIRLEKVVAADWLVDRGGLLDLDDPAAKAAGLTDEEEPVQIYFYVITHPTHGRYLVDTGMETRLEKAPETSPLRGIVGKFAKLDRVVIHQTTREWLEQHPGPLSGVFLTHMHVDHIMGVPDLEASLPIYVGPEESTGRLAKNLLVRGTVDEFLAGGRTLSQLRFPAVSAAGELAVLDFFGDRSLFVLSVPGHTRGSLAFVVNSEAGPHLIVGDTCHTRWGWENAVPPGGFTEDIARNRESLVALRRLAQELPAMRVHLGHQSATASGKLEPF